MKADTTRRPLFPAWARNRPREAPDDDYADFVAALWDQAGVDLGAVELSYWSRFEGGERRVCHAARLVRGTNGALYLNVVDDGLRLSFNVANGHDWQRDGVPLDEAGFGAVYDGAATLDDLRKVHPRSVEEALLYDRAAGTGPSYVLGYRHASGETSYRIVSRVRRGADTLSARCHLRWGQRRTFRKTGVVEVYDRATGEAVPLASFLAGARGPKAAGLREKGP